MKKSKVRFEYDADVDAAYLRLRPGKVAESEEVEPGLVVDFNSTDEIIGVEILRFARRFIRKATSNSSASAKRRKSAA